MKRKLFLLLLFISAFYRSYSQFDNRVSFYGFVGVPIMGKDNALQIESIFKGYKPFPYFGGIAQYAISQHFHIGISVRQLFSSKPHYSLRNTSLGMSFKYNFLPADKLFSPFINIEPNINYTYIHQKDYSALGQQQATAKDQFNNSPLIRAPDVEIHAFPVGFNVALGTDFTLKKKYGLFISLNYFTNNAKSLHIVRTSFLKNTSAFNYFTIQTGIKLSFLRSKNVY